MSIYGYIYITKKDKSKEFEGIGFSYKGLKSSRKLYIFAPYAIYILFDINRNKYTNRRLEYRAATL